MGTDLDGERVMQIQRSLSSDSSVQDIQRVALVEVDSKAKVGASLGYNVRTLLKDLGMEVGSESPRRTCNCRTLCLLYRGCIGLLTSSCQEMLHHDSAV